ncbi:MAG: aminopeptidase [Gaiellaceae bacterium]
MAAVSDPRVEQYAALLVERSLDVRPDWQVMILSTPLARPLVESVQRRIAARDAYALLRIDFANEQYPLAHAWSAAAPPELVRRLAPIDLNAVESIDARITINAPENVRDGSELEPERLRAVREAVKPYYKRSMADEIAWVGCHYPTQALAQAAGMTLPEYENFLYGACLLDWDAEERRMQGIAARFAGGEQVRIEGPDTDLTIGIAGREALVDGGHVNMPGGEFFFAPVEDSAEGVITYNEFPAEYSGNEVTAIRLRFESGVVVEASAASGEDFLLATLDTDEGARRIGELGIGCNPGIQRHTRSVLFDEKMDGTVHLAVGKAYAQAGGTNESLVHWDMVKDLRRGGRLSLDGKPMQENGVWLEP